MSLFDTDKHSEDRGSPMPNHDDKLIGGAIKSHKTLSTHYTTDADTNTGRLQMQNKQILGNDGTTNITLYGYNKALDKWGFFVTKPGVEVTTNTDLSQFIFNSSQDVLKVVTSGTTTITVPLSPGAGNTFNSPTITHNLGFVPVALAFVTPPASFSTETAPVPWTTYLGTGAIAFIVDFNETTATIIDFYALNIQATNTFSGVWTIKYYLLQETTT